MFHRFWNTLSLYNIWSNYQINKINQTNKQTNQTESSFKEDKSKDRDLEMTSFPQQGVDSERRIKLLTLIKKNNFVGVQQLIADGVDVDFEDEDGNTPLETAMKLKQNGGNLDQIIEILGNKIVHDSLQMLEGKSKKSKLSPSPKKHQEIKDKIRKKVEFSLNALKDLTDKENDIKKFTHKNVNIFVLFLEAFALQDVEIQKNLTSDEKDELINQYFGEEDNKIIKDIREKFVKRSGKDKEEKIITPQYLQNFVPKTNDKWNVESFFINLKDYVQYVYNKLNGNPQSNLKANDIRSILQSNSMEKIKCKKKLLDLFSNLVKEAYSVDLEKQEEILFDLTLNIIPLTDEDLKEGFIELRNLRHELIHDFQKYKNPHSRLKEFKKAMFDLRSKLFKYYSAREIHKELCEARLDQKLDKIIDNFRKALEHLEKEFQKETYCLSKMETQGSFEYCFQEELFQVRNENIKYLVEDYLTYFAVIDDEKRGLIGDDETENDITNNYTELSDGQRRDIFEDFKNLEGIKNFNDVFREKREELKDKCDRCGINENYFNKAITFSLNNISSDDRENVIAKVKHLTSLKNSKLLVEHKILNQDIISLCDRFIQEEFRGEIFCLNNHKDLLGNYDLPETAKEFIEKELRKVINKEEIIEIQSEGLQINIAKVINNILKVFYNSYYKYQIKFDNVEAAFSDKIFLDFLVSQDVEKESNTGPMQKKFKFKDKNYIFRIIKKMLKEEFTAPYVTSLITKAQSDEVIEEDDLRTLIEILCKKNTYIFYLSELLHVKSEKFNLYDVFYNIFEKEEINAESMHVLFVSPKHVREMINVLNNRIDAIKNNVPYATIKSTKYFLKILNDVILEWIYKGKNGSAIEILGVEDKSSNSLAQLYEKLKTRNVINIHDDLFIDFKLNIVKAKNAEGQEKKIQNRSKEAKKLHEEALQILKEIPNNQSPKALLALSRKAYTHALLHKYDDSFEEYKNVYESVIKIALSPEVDVGPLNSKQLFNQIKQSKNYENLLSASNECKKYLNIIIIRRSISFSEYKRGITSEDAVKTLRHLNNSLKICKEILSLEQINQTTEYITILPIRRRIILIYNKMGSLRSKWNQYSEALWYYFCALQEATMVFKKEEEIYGENHESSKSFLLDRFKNIACTYKKLNKKSAAHKIFTKINDMKKDCLGE